MAGNQTVQLNDGGRVANAPLQALHLLLWWLREMLANVSQLQTMDMRCSGRAITVRHIARSWVTPD